MFTYKNINLTNNDVRFKKENVLRYFVKIFAPDILYIRSIVTTRMSSIKTILLKLIRYTFTCIGIYFYSQKILGYRFKMIT